MTKIVSVSLNNDDFSFFEFEFDVDDNKSEDEIYETIVDYVLSNIQIEII